MKKILISLFITLFLCTSAQAYSVGFDVSGVGGFQTIDRLYLDGVDESDIAGNPSGATFGDDHLWSFEDANGYFTESFTMDITSADLTAGGKYSASSTATVTDANWDHYFVDVTLQGSFVAGVAYFSYGDATMYIDDTTAADKDYVAADDTMVAELTLNSNQTMILDNTTVGTGVAGQIDMLFTYTASGVDFWDDATDALVGKGWLLSFLDGEIHVEEELFGMAAGDYTEPAGWTHGEVVTGFGWNVNGVTADFRPIPEPATMFLLGSGLLGLVGIGRKRFFKKD